MSSSGPGRGTRLDEISLAQARRIAVAAQRLGRAPPAVVDLGTVDRLVRQIGVVQIDSVNVVARAHLLPLFSRLGPYPVAALNRAAWPDGPRDRRLAEAWAHEASLVPVGVLPLLRWRQEEFAIKSWLRVDRLRREHPGFVERVLQVIADHGPSSAGEVDAVLEGPHRGRPGWWEWSATKTACEYLFATGALAVAHRRGFERRYDLVQRVLPPHVLTAATPSVADAKRMLIALAARGHGIATAADLADYYRFGVADARQAVTGLVESGEVVPVQVRGWKETAYLHRDARIPRSVGGAALLCPFDPLIWFRPRTERLFGFHYRIEIYTPVSRRRHGYYVLPLLVGDRLVARFDLKADRVGSRLLVQASWVEAGADPEEAADAAATELAAMASWLELGEVVVLPRGDLWRALRLRPGMSGVDRAEIGGSGSDRTETRSAG